MTPADAAPAGSGPRDADTQRRRHSSLGLASVALFFVNTSIVLLVLVLLLSTPKLSDAYTRRFNASLPLGTCAAPVAYAVGLVLAIVGLRNQTHRRLFPVLGIILNALALPAEVALNALWILLNV